MNNEETLKILQQLKVSSLDDEQSLKQSSIKNSIYLFDSYNNSTEKSKNTSNTILNESEEKSVDNSKNDNDK